MIDNFEGKWIQVNPYFELVTLGGELIQFKDYVLTLQRYAKQIWASTKFQGFPFSNLGAASAVKHRDRYFVFCSSHQLEQKSNGITEEWEVEKLYFQISEKGNYIQPDHAIRPRPGSWLNEYDFTDVRIFEFEKYAMLNFDSEFFPLDLDNLWPRRSTQLPLYKITSEPWHKIKGVMAETADVETAAEAWIELVGLEEGDEKVTAQDAHGRPISQEEFRLLAAKEAN